MEKVTLQAEPRKAVGSKVSRTVRANGRLPAIIYGHGETPEPISLAAHEVDVALAHGARMLDVRLGSETKPYLIKEVQYDHLQSTPIHLDLTRVDLTEKVRVMVGIELRGVPKGLAEGGVLEQPMAEIEVECLVTAIPDTLHPNVAHLLVGESLTVKDLKLPDGVEALAEPDDRVATVRLLAAEAEEAPAAAAEGETPAEPERIGRVRKDEEGEEEKKK